MAVDANIPLSVKTPTVADMLSSAQSMQQLQFNQNKLAGQQAANEVNANDYMDEQGNINKAEYNKALRNSLQSHGAGNLAPEYEQNRSASDITGYQSKAAEFENHNKSLKQNQQDILNLMADDSLNHEKIMSTAEKMRQQGRIDENHYNQLIQNLKTTPDNPVNNKLLLNQALGQVLSIEQRLPDYRLEKLPNGNYRYLQARPTAIDPTTGQQGVQYIGPEIPSSDLTEYTDENGIKRIDFNTNYRNKISGANGQGLQVGTAPGTQQDIASGGQAKEATARTAVEAKQAIAPLQQARDIIDQHKDDPDMFGATSNLEKRLSMLATSLHIPFDTPEERATAITKLNALGIDPSQSTYKGLRDTLDQNIGKHSEAILKNEAQVKFQDMYGNDPSQQKQFDAAWNQVDRNAAIYKNKKSAQERADYYNSLSDSQKKSLINSLKFLKQLGIK